MINPYISDEFILIGLIISAAAIVLFTDWRLALFALLVQYGYAAWLLTLLLPSVLAVLRVLAGAFAALILYITFRRMQENYRRALVQAKDDAAQLARVHAYWQVFIVGLPFRVFALALVAVGIIGIASSVTFLNVTPNVLFGGLWLIAVGVLVAILSRDVLRWGLGLLLFTSGFAILESATESSLLMYGLILISDLLLALVIAHLAMLPAAPGAWRRRRGEVQ